MPGVLDAIDKVIGWINNVDSSVTYKSDKVTYPKGLAQVDDTFAPFVKKNCVFLEHTNVVTADDDIEFVIQGNFGYGNNGGVMDADRPVLANVFFDLGSNSAVFGTSATFQASAADTAIGPPENPRLQFFITGSFKSLGGGSCTFSATLEVDTNGNVDVVTSQITSGTAVATQTGAGLRIDLEASETPNQ
jgi:hypothetical protein